MSASRRLTLLLTALCIGLLLFSAYMGWHIFVRTIRMSFAEDQMQVFEIARRKALASDAADAALSLRSVTGYYPSGTKQTTGTSMDRVVEQFRARAVEDIIAHLRAQTGEDLGSEPGPWIQRFATEKPPAEKATQP